MPETPTIEQLAEELRAFKETAEKRIADLEKANDNFCRRVARCINDPLGPVVESKKFGIH